jgi:4-diphosphocytidyl-2-C-methyl-D-erythritol kinase
MFFHYKSYAKCNLSLQICNKKENGMHEINTLISYINIADNLIFEEANCDLINIKGRFANKFKSNQVLKQKNNLITKTLNEIRNFYSLKQNFVIHLEKMIPISSGLGGGSSNAATVIEFCNNYFDLKISEEEKKEIAIKIGSDVNFFNQDQIAICSDIGQDVMPIKSTNDIYNLYGVIIDPMTKSSTSDIYKTYSKLHAQKKKSAESDIIDINILAKLGRKIDITKYIKSLQNDLQEPASMLSPSISIILDFLKGRSYHSFMSGAGSSCIALFEDQNSAYKTMFEAKNAFPFYYIDSIRILPNKNMDLGKSSINSGKSGTRG